MADWSIARRLPWLAPLALVVLLAACGSVPVRAPVSRPAAPASPPVATFPLPSSPATGPATGPAIGPALLQAKSRWVPVAWSDLAGWGDDDWFDAWSAWVRSCERASGPWVRACSGVRSMSLASSAEQREWLVQRFQAYRVESLDGDPVGRLTGYFEPELEASRVATATFAYPLYRAPADLAQRKPWYTRKEADTLPAAQAALADRVIAYVADPVDALVMQIQGSGRLRFAQPGGTSQVVRLAFAGTNDQPYQSVGRWLLDQGLVRDASWPGIKAWIAANPQRRQELLWSNPRMVFFREEAMPEVDANAGPRGSQGVPLTPQRSIAVDQGSIPFGTPVWMVSAGTQTSLRRLVLAQDTGSAITGAVRADYFTGWGPEAAELAGRLHQPLQLWAIWPR